MDDSEIVFNPRHENDSMSEDIGPNQPIDANETIIDEMPVHETPRTTPINKHEQLFNNRFDQVWHDIDNMFKQHEREMQARTDQIRARLDAEISELRNRLQTQCLTPPHYGTGDHATPLVPGTCIDKNKSSQPSVSHTVYPSHSINMASSGSQHTQRSQDRIGKQNSDSVTKMKPQYYDGTEDLEDYLSQFEILADLNNWSYDAKSLYLASCLKGDARSMLSELSADDRRDFHCLVRTLKLRFGSLNRAEIFKANLQTRVKRRDESISELAQSVKKLTRQAYPDAPHNVISTLALDNFIDALPESDMRLRLREAQVKDIAEAEILALRLETYRVADRQRTNTSRYRGYHVNEVSPHVESTAGSSTQNNGHQQDLVKSVLDGFRHEFKSLSNDIKQVVKSVQQKPSVR